MSVPVVIGAGPAGIRAVETLVAHGLRPVLIDEAARAGGQIYRRPPKNFSRSANQLYGTEADRATALHSTLDDLGDAIDYRPNSLVWNATKDELDVWHAPSGVTRAVPWQRLIAATGATDRILPLPGWTLPGSYSLGGAQVSLKFQGCAIGKRVVFMGTGPLLYLVAYQYAKAGAQVAAVLDTASLTNQVGALPRLLSKPATFSKGLFYVGWLRSHGVPLHSGITPVRILGESNVNAVVFRDGVEEKTVVCDAVGFGYALRSETQVADLLGCTFSFSRLQRAHLPERDVGGRSSVHGVYLAGDGAGIMGADAAEWAGELAALSLLADDGMAVNSTRVRYLEKRLARITFFREGLERAFPFPCEWAGNATDELIVCRCENITAGELRQAARETGAEEVNRLKALTRVGMGRCQGRMCSLASAELLAEASGVPIDQVGRLRSQAPIKPIPLMTSFASETDA